MGCIITYHCLPEGFDKSASAEKVQEIMDEVYAENPKYWPYGLTVGQHDGGVYMIREASTRDPVGWVGWQERMDSDRRRIGYYSVGLLPEARGKGMAKEAVSKIIQIKSAGVDEVRALIERTNEPSQRLALALGVGIELN